MEEIPEFPRIHQSLSYWLSQGSNMATMGFGLWSDRWHANMSPNTLNHLFTMVIAFKFAWVIMNNLIGANTREVLKLSDHSLTTITTRRLFLAMTPSRSHFRFPFGNYWRSAILISISVKLGLTRLAEVSHGLSGLSQNITLSFSKQRCFITTASFTVSPLCQIKTCISN